MAERGLVFKFLSGTDGAYQDLTDTKMARGYLNWCTQPFEGILKHMRGQESVKKVMCPIWGM